MLMIAFAMEWGWWAVPAAVAVGAAIYYWNLKTHAARGAAPGEFLTVDEVRQALNRGEQLQIADVRSESAYSASGTTVYGAVRLHPARPLDDARALGLKPHARIITFCA
jgi:hypothetical protein